MMIDFVRKQIASCIFLKVNLFKTSSSDVANEIRVTLHAKLSSCRTGKLKLKTVDWWNCMSASFDFMHMVTLVSARAVHKFGNHWIIA